TEATVVDHIKPHCGDMKLFWNRNNWQSLCKGCHDSIKQAEEKGRKVNAIGLDGWPINGD
ncbi:HNH endonuclease signature motif containing protein, partial [Snodgrassella sp. CFCC 13594]|uniref:HNH endonuclease signature motif containing protein n=1 Tax=Snodgrassella sp. CFCC 13594 TaxID=1775559 RepID=UPI000AC78718